MGLFSRKAQVTPEPDPIGAITAAGQAYRVSSYADATRLGLQRQLWQQQAFALHDTEGHLHYATEYVGSAMSRVRLVAAKKPKDDDGKKRPEIITDGPLEEAVRAIQSANGGQPGFLRQVARNVFLVGECWIIATDVASGPLPDSGFGNVRSQEIPQSPYQQSWDAVSINELRVSGSSQSFLRRSLPGESGRPLPEGALTMRIWRESVEYSGLADSGVRAAMPLLEKIVLINKAEKAIARSRIAGSGILALPQELVPPAWQNQQHNPDAMQSNPLWQAVAESMTKPLADEDHPSAVVPLVVIGPADIVSKIKYEPMTRSFDTTAANASIQIAVEQLATSLDIPKEVIMGQGDSATRFAIWSVSEATFAAHLKPLIELICMALTKTYLQQAFAKMSPAELKATIGDDSPDDYIVWYDASQLITRPDKGDAAQALHDRFVLSDEALRREAGFTEDDKPTKEEYAKRVGVKLADAKMALTGKPTEAPAPAAPAGGASAGPKAQRASTGPEASPRKAPARR